MKSRWPKGLVLLGALFVAFQSSAVDAAELGSYPFMPLPCGLSTDVTTYDEFEGNLHRSALDFPVEGGTTVVSPASGVLKIFQDAGRNKGNYAEVHADDGRIHRLLHLRGPAPDFNKGIETQAYENHGLQIRLHNKRIELGQKIGTIGNTGFSFGDHLHYEVRDSQNRMIPIDMGGPRIQWNRPSGERRSRGNLVSANCGSSNGTITEFRSHWVRPGELPSLKGSTGWTPNKDVGVVLIGSGSGGSASFVIAADSSGSLQPGLFDLLTATRSRTLSATKSSSLTRDEGELRILLTQVPRFSTELVIQVSVDRPDGFGGDNSKTVTSPNAIVTPSSGTRATQFGLTSAGFTPFSTVGLEVFNPDGSRYPLSSSASQTRTDASGRLVEWTWFWEAGEQLGTYRATFTDLTTGKTTESRFTITDPSVRVADNPQVAISPTLGSKTTQFGISSSGWSPNSSVKFKVYNPDGSLYPLGRRAASSTDSQGRIREWQWFWEPGEQLGQYRAEFTDASTGKTQVGFFSILEKAPRLWDASVVRQAAFLDSGLTRSWDPHTAVQGDSGWVVFEIRNTGAQAWIPGAQTPVRVGTSGPRDRSSSLRTDDWLSRNRAVEVSSKVQPGETTRFVFKVELNRVGRYSEDFELVADGERWFGPTMSFTATATAPVKTAEVAAPGSPKSPDWEPRDEGSAVVTWSHSSAGGIVDSYTVEIDGRKVCAVAGDAISLSCSIGGGPPGAVGRAIITASNSGGQAQAAVTGRFGKQLDLIQQVARCNGLDVTVDLSKGQSPTEGDDVIRGTSGRDVINGLGGSDTICALSGNDTIDAGDGFDRVFAGSGDDTISGGSGNDLLIGGKGDDMIDGGNGNDRIQGGDGADRINGGNGRDRISGGNGNDILRGGKFNDTLFGNLGRDQLFGDEGDDIIRGGAWRDIMNGGDGANDGCTFTDPAGLVETRVNCEGGVYGR